MTAPLYFGYNANEELGIGIQLASSGVGNTFANTFNLTGSISDIPNQITSVLNEHLFMYVQQIQTAIRNNTDLSIKIAEIETDLNSINATILSLLQNGAILQQSIDSFHQFSSQFNSSTFFQSLILIKKKEVTVLQNDIDALNAAHNDSGGTFQLNIALDAPQLNSSNSNLNILLNSTFPNASNIIESFRYPFMPDFNAAATDLDFIFSQIYSKIGLYFFGASNGIKILMIDTFLYLSLILKTFK